MNSHVEKRMAWQLTMMILCAAVTMALADEPEFPAVDGVFGMENVADAAWLAIRVDVPEGQALAGLTWYNNDESTVYEHLLVGTGFEESPGDISDFLVVASEVEGLSSDWSQVTLDLPVVASLGSLYVVFVLPSTEVLTGRGAGGGPGIGYCLADFGQQGWLGGGDDVWARLHESYGFAVIPELMTAEPGMAVKSLGPESEITEPIEPFLAAGPNPFNPAIEIRFGLKEQSQVKLDVYDIRGRRVDRLIDESLGSGEHRVTWRGKDGYGRDVASGVYFIRVTADALELTQRVTLVR
jgi:hypothetical protein